MPQNRTCALCRLKQDVNAMQKLARNEFVCLDTKGCYLRLLTGKAKMQEQLTQCPECGSSELTFDGEISGIDFDTEQDQLQAVYVNQKSDQKYQIGCSGCGSQIKLTKDGARAIKQQ